jgi:hypothetical protein
MAETCVLEWISRRHTQLELGLRQLRANCPKAERIDFQAMSYICFVTNKKFMGHVPTGRGPGTNSVVGDWNESRGGMARTEGREKS